MRRRSAGHSITLTGRGGIVVIFGVGLLSALLGVTLDVGSLPGAGFVAGCALAAVATRKDDLLALAVSPPLVFLAITVTGEFVAAIGAESMLRSVSVGVVTTFASNAPWLFSGTALVVIITLPRGLLTAVRALRSARPRRGGGTGGHTGSRGGERGGDQADDDPVRWDN